MLKALLEHCFGEKGQAVVEYAIVLSVVVIVAAAIGLSPLGDVVAAKYQEAAALFSGGEEIP